MPGNYITNIGFSGNPAFAVIKSYLIPSAMIYMDDLQRHFEKTGKPVAMIRKLEFGEPGTRHRAEDPGGQRWMFIQKI